MRQLGFKLGLLGSVVLMVAGCASVPLKPGANKIVVGNATPAKQCKYLGTLASSDNNGTTTVFTSHANLIQREVNIMRNQAVDLHANYLQIIVHQDTYLNKQTNLINTHKMMGRAYVCPAKDIPAAMKIVTRS